MRSIDHRTIKEYGLSSYELMDRTGCRIAEVAQRILGSVVGKKIAVVCGKGNNGGDGLVAARYLHQQGASVDCYVLANRRIIIGDVSRHLERLEEAGLPPTFLTDLPLKLPDPIPTLIIDALLGTGLRGAPRPPYMQAITEINSSPSPILSVDTPSGLSPDSGYPKLSSSEAWPCVRAQNTLSIGLTKVDLVTYPGRSWSGIVEVADIGFPKKAIDMEQLYLSMPERNEMANIIPAYLPSDHKGSRGRIAVVAGSPGMTGAATLTSRAALRSGSGMVLLGSPKGLMSTLSAKHTEVMVRGLPETAEGALSLDAVNDIESLSSWADVLAIGPGLTQTSETKMLVRQVVSKCKKPIVIDADGINAFSGHVDDLAGLEPGNIMTPHASELSRLTGIPLEEIETNRIELAKQTAISCNITLVLKGAATLVASPSGRISVNPTGNSGMATAGSGDVLTGILAALLGQGLSAWDAARLGVYLHGLAGDLGVKTKGQHSLVAGDLIDYLPSAFLSTSQEQFAR